jgi:carboxymethylenebutenolidase
MHQRQATVAAMTTNRAASVTLPDGTMPIHLSFPELGHGPGIMLVHEIFGVAEYIQSVAARLASAGYVVGVPELFWRFAPGWTGTADETGTTEALRQVSSLDRDQAIADLGAALDVIGSDPGVDGTPAVLGFCLGGTLAFGVAARFEPAACVCYYGSGVRSMLDCLDDVRCPTLFHFGSLDQYIPGDDIAAVAAASSGRDNVAVNVEIAGHAFDNVAPMFHDEAAARSAWSKTMGFLAEHLPVNS